MELFEFVLTLLSILIGLAIAEVLSGAGRMIRRRRTQPLSWFHGAFVFGVFLAMIQLWWESWDLRGITAWNVATMVFFLVPPVAVFLLAHVIIPDADDTGGYEAHYFANRKVVWSLVAIAQAAAMLFRPLGLGTRFDFFDSLSSLLTIALAGILIATQNRRAHVVGIAITIVAVVFDIAFGLFEISGATRSIE